MILKTKRHWWNKLKEDANKWKDILCSWNEELILLKYPCYLSNLEEIEIKLPTSATSLKKQESSRKHLLCFIDYAKAFDCRDHKKLWKILQEMGIPDHLTCLLRNLCAGQEQQLELDMEQQTSSKLGKEYIKDVYHHPAYLTYMQSTSWEMLGWMKHKLESRLLGEISITSDMQMTPPLWQKVKN